MVVSLDRVEDVAPDQASLNAAKKLLKASKWPSLQIDQDATLLWGECQGSGATPYRMAVAVHDLGAKCSCPSRKFPCKHSIALMWWQATEPERFTTGEVPEWVSDWLSRRRGSTKDGDDDQPKPKKSLAAADVAEKPKKRVDPKRAAEQRERTLKQREAAIAQGLDELDGWIHDQIEQGFGAFTQRAAEQCRTMSRRLADAKAPGLSIWVEDIARRTFAAREPDRLDLLLREFGALHLIAEAYRRQDALPAELRADVRALVGWTTSRDDLLADSSAPRERDRWAVLGSTRTARPDKLIQCDTWLIALGDASIRTVSLTDFVPQSNAAGWAPPGQPGDVLDAELVFYPSAAPQRAIAQNAATEPASDLPSVPAAPHSLADAVADYERQLADHPWLNERLISMRGAVRRHSEDELWLIDPDDPKCGVRIDEAAAAPLAGLGVIDMHGLFDGTVLRPLAAATPLGPFWSAR